MDSSLRARETTSWRTNTEPPRRTRRDGSQAINDSRRESPNEEAQTFQSPKPLLLDFQGNTLSITHNKTRTANVDSDERRLAVRSIGRVMRFLVSCSTLFLTEPRPRLLPFNFI